MNGVVAIVADRLGWEERQLVDRLRDAGVAGEWVGDDKLGLGLPKVEVPEWRLAVIRSRSYVRGRLVATLLTEAGVRTLNTPQAIATCENKVDLLRALHEANIAVPPFRLILSRDDLATAVAEFGLPMVVKPLFGGLGRRVLLIRDHDTVNSFYDYVEDLAHSYERVCVAEPYVSGANIRCFVVGDHPIATVEFRRSDTEWRSNAAMSSTAHAVSGTDRIEDVVRRVVDVLGPGIYGVDLFDTADGVLVGEVNHVPGFRAISSIAPVDIAAAISGYLLERER